MYARGKDMPGALAPLHVNEKRRQRLTHKGYGGKERRDASFLPASLFPVSCQRATTWDWGCKEDR